jgi:hypothetical protein
MLPFFLWMESWYNILMSGLYHLKGIEKMHDNFYHPHKDHGIEHLYIKKNYATPLNHWHFLEGPQTHYY